MRTFKGDCGVYMDVVNPSPDAVDAEQWQGVEDRESVSLFCWKCKCEHVFVKVQE